MRPLPSIASERAYVLLWRRHRLHERDILLRSSSAFAQGDARAHGNHDQFWCECHISWARRSSPSIGRRSQSQNRAGRKSTNFGVHVGTKHTMIDHVRPQFHLVLNGASHFSQRLNKEIELLYRPVFKQSQSIKQKITASLSMKRRLLLSLTESATH